MDRVQDILNFWFEGLDDERTIDKADMSVKKWFIKDPRFDQAIKDNFEGDYTKAVAGEYEEWEKASEGRLALVILFDQFTRNMFRDSPKMFAADSKALALSKRSIEDGVDTELSNVQRVFLYMPLMHAEDLEIQKLCIESFQRLIEDSKKSSPQNTFYFEYNLQFARKHYDIIKAFGRFPHRNAILGRESTPEEREFLTKPGSSF